ncbi:uncharacterized protein [Marmota flaviventris]|uniref:uncharacterized protein isoform X4 n=1 Tax=Marmota flaviventris TaxID=93162 RepID=UPI003A887587
MGSLTNRSRGRRRRGRGGAGPAPPAPSPDEVSLVEDPSLTFHTGSPLSPAILLPAPQDSSISSPLTHSCTETLEELLLHPSNIQDFQALNKIGPSGVTIARHLPTIIIASMMPCTPNKCSEATFSHQEKSTED